MKGGGVLDDCAAKRLPDVAEGKVLQQPRDPTYAPTDGHVAVWWAMLRLRRRS